MLALVGPLIALPATPAYAHGISSDARDYSLFEFLPLGITHMITGWDHLAFIAGVLLIARSFKLSIKLISLFVLGHSTTLILATALGWRVNAGYVEAVIAASVAFVGIVGIFGRPQRWGWFAAVVTCFGLVHGLGLATRFDALGLPDDGRIAKVVVFNIGVELGQATAIFVMFLVGTFVGDLIRDRTLTATDLAGDANSDAPVLASASALDGDDYYPVRTRKQIVMQVGSAALLMGGAVGSGLLTLEAATADEGPVRTELADDSTCDIGTRSETLPAAGGHPAKSFYGPSEELPINEFGHALGDGYVIALYSSDLLPAQVFELESIVNDPAYRGLLSGAVSEDAADELPGGGLNGKALRVIQAADVMTCDVFEPTSLRQFTTDWVTQS